MLGVVLLVLIALAGSVAVFVAVYDGDLVLPDRSRPEPRRTYPAPQDVPLGALLDPEG